MQQLDIIGFGGSCHWCTEAIFQSVRGVARVEQGWIAPLNSDTFSEAVLVHFDSAKSPLELLVEIHLLSHSSTSAHSMRNKYRSAVYVFNEHQKEAANEVMINLQPKFEKPIITQILDFGKFELNSEEFLNYYKTNPERPFCTNYITPKLKALLERLGPRIISVS